MHCNLKTCGCRVKQSENWDSGVFTICILGTFDLLVFSVILGGGGGLGKLVSKWPITRKWLAVEQNRVKFRTCWYLYYPVYIWGTFDLKVFTV